jgi:hypothetical protein
MDLEDFDAELEAAAAAQEAEEDRRLDIVPPANEDEPEPETSVPLRRQRHRVIRMLLEQPQVAEMFVRGDPHTAIAKRLGVSVTSVRNMWLNPSMTMRNMLKSEAQRVAAHLGTRDLGGESYSKLAFALRQLNEQVELLDGRPTNRTEVYGQGTVESITLALFGVPRERPRGDISNGEAHRVDGESEAQGLLGAHPPDETDPV